MSDLGYLLNMDVSQKLDLIGVLWQSIDDSGQTIEMPDSLVDELDRRKAAALKNPESLVPWETIRRRLGLPNG